MSRCTTDVYLIGGAEEGEPPPRPAGADAAAEAEGRTAVAVAWDGKARGVLTVAGALIAPGVPVVFMAG
ncbi:hypothetical protein [Streptomyces spiralis]|uniref:hypothetical protein n=1 Tax=Streptomyces spiralis TaxID=66376 RepID=UPI0036AC3A76